MILRYSKPSLLIWLVTLTLGWFATNVPAQTPRVITGPIVNPANGHQYYLLEPTTWTNAELAAIALGGHLVTCNSSEENTWVYDTFADPGGTGRDLWIGLFLPDPAAASQDAAQRRKQFVWASGQSETVQVWAETNLVRSGYCKLLGPNNPLLFDRGRWAEEIPSALVNSVVELPLPLEIVSQPKTISVGIGSDAIFTVLADGNSPISYQWQSGGTSLPGETRATLTLTNVQPSESGSFSVVVSNASGTLTSTPAFFSVAGIVGWGSWSFFDTRTNIPTGLTSILAIATGDRHDLALKSDGTVVAWGEADYNQLSVPADLTNVVAIAGALYHSLALKADGTVVSWGYNVSFTGNWVPSDLSGVVAIDANGYHNLALKADGTVVAWGGDGALPSVAPASLTNVVAISAGGGHNLALKADGTVAAWVDTTGEYLQIPDGVTNVIAISAGMGDSLALRADGTLVGWGEDNYGQLEIPPGLTNVVAIAAKSLHSLALKADGTVVGWGNNWGGESSIPPALPNCVAIAAGYNHSLCLLRDGAPNVTVQPWDQSVSAGTSPTFSAKVVGVQSMGYQWRFNGTNLVGATHDTLKIPNAQSADTGVYTLAVSNEVGAVASRHAKLVVSSASLPANHAPILPVMPDQWIGELTQLVVTNSAEDSDMPAQGLTYQLINPPSGATIDSNGIIRWTSGQVQGASTNVFITVAIDNGVPPLSATNRFAVVVSKANQAPLLPWQRDRTISKLTEMIVMNNGMDWDVPTNTFSYQLIAAPAGAVVDANGVIRWTPTEMQGPSTNLVMTVVTDDGLPPLSATNQFMVIVLDSTNGAPLGVTAGPIVNPANGHQYFLIEPASWLSAERAASALGGHLVTLNNSDEMTWVYNTFGHSGGVERDLWTGLYDPDPSIAFTSLALETAKFAWSSGQPAPVGLEMWGNFGPYYRQLTYLGYAKIGSGLLAEEAGSSALSGVVELPLPLEIISQPQCISVGMGCDATLSVCADGVGPIHYQWQRSGTNLVGETSASLTLTNAQPSQSDAYSVIVSNSTGTLTSAPILFTVVGIVTWGAVPGVDLRTNVPPGLTSVIAIAAGWRHDLALESDGTVVAWGDNSQNQLNVPPGLTNVTAVAAGGNYSLALRNDGTVTAWGTSFLSATQVPPGLINVIAVDAGSFNNLALKNDGTVVTWGSSGVSPSVAPRDLTNVVAISAGGGHDLALKADGSVVDWNDATAEPNATPADLTNIVAISAGDSGASLALRADGTVVGWGPGWAWQGAFNMPAGLSNVVAISAKAQHPLALKADGTVVAWGSNWVGEASVPAALPNVVAIAAGFWHTVALLRDGAPKMTVEPWDRSVPLGGSQSFVAKAVGLQSMAYQWRFNGKDISGATHDTLSIPNAQLGDAGAYTLAVSNQVGVVASRPAKLVVGSVVPVNTNHPPVLPAQPNWAIYELTKWSVANTASDPDHSTNALTYELVGAPAGATIDSFGVIRWTPTEEEGPSRVLIKTVVTKLCQPKLSATNSFFVSVNEQNSKPVLPAQSDRIISALTRLTIVNAAIDQDIPVNTLTYELINPPAGATIDGVGVIRWTPTRTQGPSTNTIMTIATDHGSPSLSATNVFTIVVKALQPTVLAPASMNNGAVRLRVTGSIGPDYILQTSLDLKNWLNLQTNCPAIMPFEFSDTTLSAGTNRFYRVRLGP